MGAPPSTYFPSNLRPHRPCHIALGHPFLYLYTSPNLFFTHLVIVQNICFQPLHSFLSSPLATLFFLEKETHVTLVWGIHYILLMLTFSINPEYPIVHVPLISKFVHFVRPLAQFNPSLVIPLTLDSVV
jgi:hypothetical protein